MESNIKEILMKPFSLLFLLLPCQGIAQNPTIFHYSVSEGLPSSEAYDVYQDRAGFLWFATDNGVARYDGREFEAFDVSDGLTDPVVFGVQEDRNDNIWFRTFSGRLCYFDGEKICPYKYNATLLENRNYGFFNFQYEAASQRLWFTMAHIFGTIDANGKVNTQTVDRGTLYMKSIDGKLLQANDLKHTIQTIIIDGQRFPVSMSDTTENKFYNTISVDDKIYVSLYKDVFKYEKKQLKKILTSKQPIISLSGDREGALWIGYLNNGVERFSDLTHRWKPAFLKNKSVTKVLEDAAGGFWFTTLESGAYYVPDFQIHNEPLPAQSRIKTVLALKDTVLVGTQAGELLFLDATTANTMSKKKYADEVYALFKDTGGYVWISAGMDIVRFNSQLKPINRYHQLIATSFDDGPLGTTWAYGGVRMTSFDKNGTLIRSRARFAIYRGGMLVKDSVIYLSGRTGLHTRNLRMEFLHEFKNLSGAKINQIESLNDSTVVLATQGNGLILLDQRGQYRQYNRHHQFISDNIYCLSITDSTLWLGTENGLIALSIKHLVENDIRFKRISQRTGLIADKINYVLPVKDNIWTFTDEGISIVPKTRASTKPSSPRFYLKRISTGSDTIVCPSGVASCPIILPYHKNNLTFAFRFVSITNQDVFMRYRVARNMDWILTPETVVQFSSLAPGSYSFELQFSLDNIHWTPALESIPFTIDSPWWRKWYTQAAAVLFLFLLGCLYFQHRQSIYRQKNHYLRIINEHQQKLIRAEIDTRENERKRIARELHDGVGTNLTAIKLMVNQLLQHHHEPRTKDIEEMFQTALKELKDIIYGLTPPSLARYGLFAALRNYVSRLNQSLPTSISLQVFGKEINNYDFNIMVFRIVQELISNSIKHASAHHINIHVNAFDDILNIIYEDDGVGFAPGPDQQGLGLANIESRIQTVNGNIKFDSGGHGVSYTIDIPLHSIREPA